MCCIANLEKNVNIGKLCMDMSSGSSWKCRILEGILNCGSASYYFFASCAKLCGMNEGSLIQGQRCPKPTVAQNRPVPIPLLFQTSEINEYCGEIDASLALCNESAPSKL